MSNLPNEFDSQRPELQFVLNGRLGDLLREYYLRDEADARLSLKFKAYYMLRPLIPLGLRHLLQRSRNRNLNPGSDWFLPTEFCNRFKALLESAVMEESGMSVLHPWPDGHQIAVSLTHDVETAEGMQRIDALAAMEESLGLRSAWYFISHKYKLDHGLLRDLQSRGHEIGIHGYNHDGRLFASRSIFDYRTRFINLAARELGAVGFRAPMVHRNLKWMQQLDFQYDASCFDIDPFQPMPGGVSGVWPFIVGKLVELPYTLPQDHTLLITLGETTPRIWLEKLDWLRDISGMAMLITHPDYLDSQVRQSVYRQFCEHLSQSAEQWKALPHEIASWWRIRQSSSLLPDGRIIGPAAQRGRKWDLLPKQCTSC